MKNEMKLYGTTFYGNEASPYAKENGYLDYATLAKAFDGVLNNNIYEAAWELGEWEMVSGYADNSEEIDELRERIEELEAAGSSDENEIAELEDQIRELEEEYEPEIFQWYIVSDQGASILEECGEIVCYHSVLDIYLWGVTHYGTSWSYVLTNIKLNCK